MLISACGGGGGGSGPNPSTLATPSTKPATAVARIVVSVNGQVVPEGVATTVPLSVSALDAHGTPIVGAYSNPITLVDNDPSGQTSLSASTIENSTAASNVTISYKGGPMSQGAVITASAANLSPSQAGPVTFLPDESHPTLDKTTSTFATTNGGIFGGSVYGTAPPRFPTPQPDPGTAVVSVTAGATYNGQTNLVDVHTVSVTSPNPALTSDEYYAWSSSSGNAAASLLEVGSNSSQPSGMHGAAPTDGTVDTIACQAPFEIAWIAPLPPTWDGIANAGPCTEHQAITSSSPGFVDVNILDKTLRSDGSYTSSSGTSTQGAPESIYDVRTVNADGSATETATWAVSSGMTMTYPSAILVLGTPAPGSSTIPYQITNFPGAIPSPGTAVTPAPTATTMPNWYAEAGIPGGAVPSPMLSRKFVTAGTVTGLPPACVVPYSIVAANAAVTEVDETRSALDPLSSYELHQYKYFVVNGLGPVCIQETTYITQLYFFFTSPGMAGGGYDLYSSYLTSTSLTAAMARTRSFAKALPEAESSLLAGVRAHDLASRAKREASALHFNHFKKGIYR